MTTTATRRPPPPAFDRFLKNLVPEAPQRVAGLTIIPLTSSLAPRLEFVSMSTALKKEFIQISEVSEGGSVNSLTVVNTGEMAVLLLSGEEVAGAKQNRIFNTTILVDARSKIRVPVSCTEQGRWGYRSPRFADSGHIAPRSIRVPKTESVHASLTAFDLHASDQAEVWQNVRASRAFRETQSPTSALRDVMERQKKDMQVHFKEFKPVPGQIGIVAVTADGFVGLDAVSRPEVYLDLHEKLVRSYLADVVGTEDQVELIGQVDAFLADVRTSKRQVFDAPGLGTDLRLDGEVAVGSALRHRREIVHLAGFTKSKRQPSPGAWL
jgi:ARG/rhodanese/phosphatase superfamily protein